MFYDNSAMNYLLVSILLQNWFKKEYEQGNEYWD